MNRIWKSVWVGACLLLLVGCKPTEKNYQAAYLAAQNKKQAEAAEDPDMALPANALQRLDAPRTKEIDGVTLLMRRFPVKVVGEGDYIPGKYNVAVAKYKMPTNAKAQSEDLVVQKYPAFTVEGNDGYFYVIANKFDTLEETAAFVKEYKKKHASSTFVGLEGEPLIID